MSPYSTHLLCRSTWPRVLLLLLSLGWGGCGAPDHDKQPVLRLATTTSTRDSGLLELLLPPFESQRQVRVDVIAVGTGEALKLGEAGDVAVVFVHAREAEDAFVAAGHGIRREDVMDNTFELLGPASDPAGIRGLDAPAALRKIAAGRFPFVSRGDDSGTNKRELLLWKASAALPDWPEYRESGQGMGTTLTIANEMSAYVLTDRGTWLNYRDKIDLVPLAAQTPELRNRYGIIVVDPKKNPGSAAELAHAFVDYVISPAAQQIIADYRLAGDAVFLPIHLPTAD